MIEFRRRNWRERIAYALIPPYRRKQDAATRRVIERLVSQPWLPCIIEGKLIRNGYGD